MPELPEVETVKNGLNELLKKKPAIEQVKTSSKKLRFSYPRGFKKSLQGLQIEKVQRRAKYLIFQTSGLQFICHLGMTGNWRKEKDYKKKIHDHVIFQLSSGESLIYNDPRRFGYFDILKSKNLDDSDWFQHLGPEPLDERYFTGEYLFKSTRKKQTAIKSHIMNQQVVVGVGNIYASEALFAAHIKPQTKAQKVSKKTCDRLVLEIRKILNKAIRQGGSTIKDFQSAGGSEGYFQLSLNVYGRDGELCKVCKTPIKKIVITGRSTFYCPSCQ